VALLLPLLVTSPLRAGIVVTVLAVLALVAVVAVATADVICDPLIDLLVRVCVPVVVTIGKPLEVVTVGLVAVPLRSPASSMTPRLEVVALEAAGVTDQLLSPLRYVVELGVPVALSPVVAVSCPP
jgi:hypothetical protein